MTTSEKVTLEEIDRQLKDAVSFCKSEGLSPTEVTRCAKPILDWADRKKRRKRFRILIKFALLVAVAAFMWESEVCNRWLSIGLKLLQLKLLPYWDWTGLFEINCLISNPYYVGDSAGPTEDDCKWLRNYPAVHRLKSLSHDNVTNEYILRNLPVIVTDATAGWLASEEFSFSYLQQIYLEEGVLKDCPCDFVTNDPYPGKDEFLKNIKKYDSFSSHWFHCEFRCMKSFRKYYRRPYFIPPMVESGQRNFVIVGKVSDDKSAPFVAFQNFPSMDSMTWISQIRGQLHVILKSECKGVRDVEEIISAGDTLAYNKIWWMSYRATGEGESIALGSTGSWDS